VLLGLTKYFAFYNGKRPHQALGYKTPDTVYQSESGGGAMIVNKFSEEEEESRMRLTAIPGQRRSVADAVECITYTQGKTVLTLGSTLTIPPFYVFCRYKTLIVRMDFGR